MTSARLASALLAAVIVVAACGGDSTEAGNGDDDSTAAIMAAAVEQLITVDHTFGSGPPPFTEYLLQANTDPAAGTATAEGPEPRPLTDAERAAIEAVVEPHGSVRWIDDPDEWRTDDLRPTVEGGVIIGVGEPTVDGSVALAPVSLWCGGLCGTWLTYRVELLDGIWTVTGIEGPVAIS